ncbi:DNA-deoxyinosine glycosylase [Mediterraneibacter sp. NSJ-55]|uniref:DNA-deoxyinosine glycosylase n=1 Tax=Mediterraneibacter hominis TaxID=2763054 RepID=A0A923RRV6_9FIRM|nr:DNA-deoxyinosine glycosylase [Mediterraneibacter hominis]MBC5688742.1 DNA-deoxyinosine glycosylase [Mediterraneibacter hominis]
MSDQISHEFSPVFNEQSRILILGTFPSVKSREQKFYYGHPQNRFWKVIARLVNAEVPLTIAEKKTLLLDNKIAVWDVIESCEITGSSDSSIKNVRPADLRMILERAPIQKIYANGSTAKKLYDRYSLEKTGKEIIGLPSTSPANAAYSLERLLEYWKDIKTCL